MFCKTNYERFSESLNCSPEILFAIEAVTGENFERDNQKIIENASYQLWEEGGRELEILAALPIDNGSEFEDGEEIFWADEKFAEFDGEQWILERTE
jgi:hypothetical protein